MSRYEPVPWQKRSPNHGARSYGQFWKSELLKPKPDPEGNRASRRAASKLNKNRPGDEV